MSYVRAKSELKDAERFLEDNLNNRLNPAKEPGLYNVSMALAHMCRALREMADEIGHIEAEQRRQSR